MSKIEIKTILKGKNSIHEFVGKAIKKGNTIVYDDSGVLTKIVIDEVVSLERKKDYYIMFNFKNGECLAGKYQTNEGDLSLKIETLDLDLQKDGIKIKYNLIINNVFIDTFWFYLQYTIDR
ncbi:MAG: DUF1934 family protein [Bacilli bacterium]|nr:DUF1934 family protein [Bacilli bacterium]